VVDAEVTAAKKRSLAVTSHIHWVLLVAGSLAPLVWFREGLAIKGVDSFFSLHPEGLAGRGRYLWDASSSAGEPARVVTGAVNLWQTVLARMGFSGLGVEIITITLLAGAAIGGMYKLFLTLARSPGSSDRAPKLVAAIVAIVWVANPFALSVVWWHQVLLEFTWALLPWLMVLLLKCLRGEMSMRIVGAILLLVAIPNIAAFHDVVLPLVVVLLIVYGIGFALMKPRPQRAVLRGVGFAGFLVAAVGWWLVPTAAILSGLYLEAGVGPFPPTSLEVLRFSSQFSSWHNVLTLTAEPALHQTYGSVPYISWTGLANSVPGSILVFVLPTVVIVGAVHGVRNPRLRPVAAVASACVVVGAFLAKGVNPPFPGLNRALLNLPFGAIFRHPFDRFSILIVPSMCILFGFGLLTLTRLPIFRSLAAGSAIAVCGYLALPWWTGSVIPDGGGFLPSARVSMPSSYETVGSALGTAPAGGKTMILPYADDAQAAFVWPRGIQPNSDCLLADWQPNRSAICRVSGDPFANRVGATITAALELRDLRVFSLARLWGIDRWVVHSDWDSQYFAQAVGPESATAFLNDPRNGSPGEVITRRGQRVSAPTSSSGVEFALRIDRLPREADVFLRSGPLVVQVNRSPQFNGRPIYGQAYLAVRDSARGIWMPGSSLMLGQWHTIRLDVRNGRLRLHVDGVSQGVPMNCASDGTSCSLLRDARTGSGIAVANLPGWMTVQEPALGGGAVVLTLPREITTEPWQLMPRGTSPARETLETPYLRMWNQDALPLVYAAQTATVADPPFSSDRMLAAAAAIANDARPAVVPMASLAANLDGRARATLSRSDPTTLKGIVDLSGNSILILNQSFDSHWRLTVDGRPIRTADHFVVNGFANGWRIRGDGTVRWVMSYQPQQAMTKGFILAIGMMVAAVLALALPLMMRSRRS